MTDTQTRATAVEYTEIGTRDIQELIGTEIGNRLVNGSMVAGFKADREVSDRDNWVNNSTLY